MNKEKLNLRKWAANDDRLLHGLLDRSEDYLQELDISQTFKTLGLQWNTQSDVIVYNQDIREEEVPTNTVLLSQIGRLFNIQPFRSIRSCL